MAKTPKKDILIVQGNWNTKEDPDTYHHWAGTVGRFGIGETSSRGWRLLGFKKSHRLTLTNTLHPHMLSRTATSHGPNGQVHKLRMDFILTPQQRFKSSLNKANTRSFLGANAGSDHDLFFATIKLKPKTKHFMKGPTPSIRFDLA